MNQASYRCGSCERSHDLLGLETTADLPPEVQPCCLQALVEVTSSAVRSIRLHLSSRMEEFQRKMKQHLADQLVVNPDHPELRRAGVKLRNQARPESGSDS